MRHGPGSPVKSRPALLEAAMPDTFPCNDPTLLNDWHVIADQAALRQEAEFRTRLLGVPLTLTASGLRRDDSGAAVATQTGYGFVWACLGTPRAGLPQIAEAADEDRYVVTGGSIGVRVSGLRAVENFLDMGHFPFVHTGWLGEQPHTEVRPYTVEVTPENEIVATECQFYQPVASPTATSGFVVDYIYKVLRPYTVALYKSAGADSRRLDSITLFVQPLDEDNCIAHPLLCYLKEGNTAAGVRSFMQLIFAQAKPILENQVPRRLPLDPRAETPIRADSVSVVYRRWLRQQGIRYGAIPAGA